MPPPEDPSLDRCEITPLVRDLLGSHQDAEDLAHDAWLLLQRQPAGRVRSVRAWLKAAILHMGARTRQRDRRRVERERMVARAEREPSVLEQLERRSEQKLL